MAKTERIKRLQDTLAFKNFGEPLVDLLISREKYHAMLNDLHIGTERELLDMLGCDFYYMSGRDISQNEGYLKYIKTPPPMDEQYRVCPLGIRWLRKSYDSKFSVDEAVEGPFGNEEITGKNILAHKWPAASDFDFTPMLQEYEENRDRIAVGGLWSGIMGDSYRMMGFENFLLNTAMNPELVDTLISRMAQMYLELNDAIFSTLKGKLDIWFFGNDFGAQNGLLLSAEMIETLFYKHIKNLCDLAHSYGIHVMMHSCGSITKIIPMLIRAGVEIVDPIQVTALDMDPKSLAAAHGGRIVFHGGIDTQRVLPMGTPEQVVAHVKEVIETLSATGGYIFAPSQILDKDISCENILAMYDVVGKK